MPSLSRTLLAAGLLLACLVPPAGSSPLVPGWSSGFEAPGTDGDVLAFTTFRGDLIAAGRFTVAGRSSVRHIARWDGSAWHALGAGIDGDVYALAVFDGALIAAGEFEKAGERRARNIAQWTGEAWMPLGSGVDGAVLALLVHGSKLVVGGRFESAGTERAHSIAAWDGRAWSALGAGVASPEDGDAVRALVHFNGTLVAGGSFASVGGRAARSIATWDGNAWSPLGLGFDRSVESLVVYQDRLVAGGSFGLADGSSGRSIATWDGVNWNAFGSGVPGSFPTTRALFARGDELIAAGTFSDPAGALPNAVMRWNGSRWSRVGGALDGGASVFALIEYDGALVVGGSFNDAAGVVVNRIARLEDGRWLPLTRGAGTDDVVRALTIYRGDVIAGGSFVRAGARRARALARWDGGRWHSMGVGVDGDVLALHVFGDEVIAGGSFHLRDAPGRPANVVRWDGSTWRILGAGLDGVVVDFAEFRGDLYAAGTFAGVKPGGGNAHLVRWDGVAWHDAGLTLDVGIGEPSVNALTVFQNELVLGGRFDRVNQMGIRNVVTTDGNGWYAFGGGVDEVVDDLAVFDGRLFLAGFFNFAGGVFAPQVAAWDGFAWSAVGTGLVFNEVVVVDAVLRLHATPNALVLGGRFDGIDDVSSANLALWDGARWRSLGSGASATTLAFASLDDALFVGGRFDVVNGVVSSRVARWEWSLPSPVLTQLSAQIVEKAIELSWRLPEALLPSVERVRVQRMQAAGAGSVTLAEVVPESGVMTLTDTDVLPHTLYAYRIHLERFVGAPLRSDDLEVPTDALRVSQLESVSDMPGHPVRIRFSVGTSGSPYALRIYDVRGRLVRRLEAGRRDRGSFVVAWDRTTDRGVRAARGSYFVRLQLSGTSATRKFVLLHD